MKWWGVRDLPRLFQGFVGCFAGYDRACTKRIEISITMAMMMTMVMTMVTLTVTITTVVMAMVTILDDCAYHEGGWRGKCDDGDEESGDFNTEICALWRLCVAKAK